MESAVVLLSGGIGSTVAACRCHRDVDVHLLYLDYGRACAAEERRAATAVAEALGVPLEIVDLPHVRQIAAVRRPGGTAKENRPRPTEPGDPTEIDGLGPTLLAVGAEYAAAVGARKLITGQMGAVFETGTPTASRERTIDSCEFHHAFAAMLETAIPAVRAVVLDAPLLDLQPFEVVKLGLRFGAPFDRTWSCHQPAPRCGTCPGCRRRAAAFAEAGVADPFHHFAAQEARPGT